jgi:hypothetical protein
MNRIRWSILKFSMGIACLFPHSPILCSQDDEANQYFDFIERVSRVSPLEHAGSHGTMGVGIGAGISVHDMSVDERVLRAHWRAPGRNETSNQGRSGKTYIPRAYFHKGLPMSLDFGLSYAQEPISKAVLVSTYGQWTIFEGFALPALAIRGGFNRLMGLATTDASVLATDLVASYGFLRIMTLYGVFGQGRYQTKIRSGDAYGTNLSLTTDDTDTVERVSARTTKSIGIQLQISPPFWTVAFESSQTGSGGASYVGKITVGM